MKEKRKIVGNSIYRKDGYDKVTGSAKYIDDLEFENCLYGKVIRSKIPHGIIKSITYDPSINWEEFVIVDYKDVPGKNIVPLIEEDQPYLAEKEVKYIGEPILLIAHPDEAFVEYASNFIKIEYEELPAILSIEESLKGDNIQFKDNNIFKEYHFGTGNIEKAWEQADIIVEGEYETGAQEHIYLEPQGAISIASPEKGVTVWGTMQCPYFVHNSLKSLFNLPDDKVRVIFTITGGAFGGKEEYPNNMCGYAALLSWKAKGKPVKLVYSREEDLAVTTKRHPSKTYIKTALKKDGTFIGIQVDTVFDGGAYATLSGVVLARGVLHSFGTYKWEYADIKGSVVLTNSPPYGAFRGFGAPQTLFAIERHIDKCAKKLNIDPVELRLKNILRKGNSLPTSQEIKENVCLDKLIEKAIKESNYYEKLKEYKKFNKENTKKKKGIGISLFFHGGGFTGSGEIMLASKAGIRANEDGTVDILCAQTEMGQGCSTTLTQIVAEELNIPVEKVRYIYPDTAKVPNSGPTVASRTCMVVGGLLHKSAKELKEILITSGLLKKDNYTYDDFINAVKEYYKTKGELKVLKDYQHPPGIEWNEEEYKGAAYPAYSWGCYVADIEIDMITYQPEVKNFIGVLDIGTVINPTISEGQVQGGATQGIGWTLFEKVELKNGVMSNSQFTNYTIPTILDIPNIKVFFIEDNPYEYGPFGAKGLGEIPMNGVAPAIVNAISFALEKDEFNKVPVLPEDVLDIIEKE